MDKHIAKAFIYKFLSVSFTYPSEELLNEIEKALPDLKNSLETLKIEFPLEKLKNTVEEYKGKILDLAGEYTYLFETGLKAPIRETAYELEKAARRASEMSDINGFYRAFGLEIRGQVEPDNLVAELEFLSFLNQKMFLLRSEGDREGYEVCKDAYVKFLRDHLGRWYEIFSEKVIKEGEEEFYKVLAEVLRKFLDKETEGIDGIVKLNKYILEKQDSTSWKCSFM